MQETQPRRCLEFHDPADSDFDNELTESLHSKISKDIIPRVGMEFETEEAASKELYKAYDCHIEISGETGAFMRYKVTPNRKQWSYVVAYDDTQENVCCTCRKFEFAGVLCSHILKAFCIRDVKEIPNKYVLQRWTKSAKSVSFGTINDSCSVDKDPKTAMARRYKDVYRVFTRLGTRAVDLEDGYILVKAGLINLLRELNLSTEKNQTCTLQKNQMRKNNSAERQDKPVNVNGNVETVKGIKLKPKSRSGSSQCPKSGLEATRKRTRKSKYTTTPKKNAQENQLVQAYGSTSQSSTNFFHSSDPYGCHYSTPLEYGQGGMYVQSIPVRSDQQKQPSYMDLLTSIGEPQVHPR